MSRTQAASCHSLVVRMPGPVDATELERRLRAGVPESRPELAGLRLWEEPPPPGADDPGAVRRRVAREAARPLRPGGPGLRAVLLQHRDGDADLVLVARHDLAFGTPDPLVLVDRTGAGSADGPAGPRPSAPEWGLGVPAAAGHTGEVPVPFDGRVPADEALLLAAVALVLARYGAGEQVDETLSAADHVRAWRERVAEPAGAPHHLSGIGILVEDARPGQRHVPYLAPVLPGLLHVTRRPDGTAAAVLYHDHGHLAACVAERFAAHVAHVAAQLADRPDDVLDTVELLTPQETARVLQLGLSPAIGQPEAIDRTVDGLFAEVARARPDAVAVTAKDTSLTYAELDARAERTAAGLRALGVTPGSMVGVALERDADLVVTLLGVFKAGCAYVPMDLRYPEERLRYTVDDAGATVVVGVEGVFPRLDGVRLVTPAALRELGAGAPSQPPRTEDPTAAAYVIYTSGSTGRPKGVVVPHRNVAALIEATREDFRLGTDDVWTLFHSSAFDFSVWEIWGCLLTGGRLVVVDYWVTRDTELFHELLAAERVTVLSQTPSAFAQLIEADRRSGADLAVRLVVFGGEPLDVRMLAPWFARHSHTTCRLVNMFGITETTVHVTAHTVTPADVRATGRRVGRALPGWSVSVRDPRGRVLPVGAAGEICVGGAGVADRYLGQPELTAERFVTDPHGGGRIYRSGDRGRLRPDGGLDHLGRLDSQVKVRGHRIELDEIRNVLLSHPEVTGAATVLQHDVPGDAATARIDAYVTLRGPAGTADVLAHARAVLPAYMVPASVTRLETIPLTINGKVDTAALPAPAPVAAAQDSAPEVPSPAAGDGDPLAAQILKLWGHELNAVVTAQDNFFELGGNSLLVIRILRQMREQGLPKVTTQDFYRNSTAGQFIELVRSAQA
ncbi:amino acid adenylation domain-containing protein [Streptomyces sp. MST-110588]|uniref:amino acid adenylation domain-containing protein n=1 Tax=Streptomyces sp. MST-110588 TaxID=2833628 RepID=UPI001F5CF9A7|nr:amino acid adenylation domain-containing protein [Streptomyces sp. MST-110588]UNO42990.1 amino acid adenylation domain-containing protein [Streptomyces sp. MST-110588]